MNNKKIYDVNGIRFYWLEPWETDASHNIEIGFTDHSILFAYTKDNCFGDVEHLPEWNFFANLLEYLPKKFKELDAERAEITCFINESGYKVIYYFVAKKYVLIDKKGNVLKEDCKLSVEEIINEIKGWPNYLYKYEGNDHKFYSVILGGLPCDNYEQHDRLVVGVLDRLFESMEHLYNKGNLSDEDKRKMADCVKKFETYSKYRISKYYDIETQKELLQSLNADALEDLSHQVQMYRDARKYYGEFADDK